MSDKLFPEIACLQRNYAGESICGDTYTHKFFGNENRTVLVLSDGMGHGVKANVLSTLTASMMANFADAKQDIRQAARIVLNNLPVCSVRKISYSTFSVVDIYHSGNEVTVAEHNNPPAMIIRGGKVIQKERKPFLIKENPTRPQQGFTTRFTAREGDRILLMTDGVTQCGLGTTDHPFGWGYRNVMETVEDYVRKNPEISSRKLAKELLSHAVSMDGGVPKDDISVVCVRFRKPVRTLLVMGMPSGNREYRNEFTDTVKGFEGFKIILGSGLAGFLSERDPDRFPFMESGSEVAEGPEYLAAPRHIALLKKIIGLGMEAPGGTTEEVPQKILGRLLRSDQIVFLIGERDEISGGYEAPYLFSEGRKLIGSLSELLEEKYKKAVTILA